MDITREIVIAAPIERVWDVITEPEHVSNWFCEGRTARVDLRPGGEMYFDHGQWGKYIARVQQVQQPTLLSYRWAPGSTETEPVDGIATLVEFHLSPEGDGTRVKIVESGFDNLKVSAEQRDKQYKDNDGGWAEMLDRIANYTATVDSTH